MPSFFYPRNEIQRAVVQRIFWIQIYNLGIRTLYGNHPQIISFSRCNFKKKPRSSGDENADNIKHVSGINDKLLHGKTKCICSVAIYRSFEFIWDCLRMILTRGGGTWVNFCWVCAAGLSEPLPHYSYSVANYRPHVSHFWANIPKIPTCKNLFTPEIPQMYDPVLVTLLAPIENATPL